MPLVKGVLLIESASIVSNTRRIMAICAFWAEVAPRLCRCDYNGWKRTSYMSNHCIQNQYLSECVASASVSSGTLGDWSFTVLVPLILFWNSSFRPLLQFNDYCQIRYFGSVLYFTWGGTLWFLIFLHIVQYPQ